MLVRANKELSVEARRSCDELKAYCDFYCRFLSAITKSDLDFTKKEYRDLFDKQVKCRVRFEELMLETIVKTEALARRTRRHIEKETGDSQIWWKETLDKDDQ